MPSTPSMPSQMRDTAGSCWLRQSQESPLTLSTRFVQGARVATLEHTHTQGHTHRHTHTHTHTHTCTHTCTHTHTQHSHTHTHTLHISICGRVTTPPTSLQVASLTFINTIVQTASSLNAKVYLQHDFLLAGFDLRTVENVSSSNPCLSPEP